MHFIDTLAEKLSAISATASKTEKLNILSTLDSQELALVVIALEPVVNFYIAKLPAVEPGTGEFQTSTALLLEDLASRRLTGQAAMDAVTSELARLKPTHQDLLRKVILKDLRAGIGEGLVNKAFPGSVNVFPYMRCSLPDKSNLGTWSEAVWNQGVISEVKLDGMFASLSTPAEGGTPILLSRQGSPFPNDALGELGVEWPGLRGMQLHGELLVFQGDELLERQVGNGILNSVLQGGCLPQDCTVQYQVWDMIPLHMAKPKGECLTMLSTRQALMVEAIKGHPCISKVQGRTVFSPQQAREHCLEIQRQGGEGTIVKNPQAIWKDGTSKDFVKFKLVVVVELTPVALIEGSGKNADTFGSVTCVSRCGQVQVDVYGFTDEVRADIHARWDQIKGVAVWAVKGNGLLHPGPNNDKHSIYLPRFAEERLDKKVADNLEEIQAQFEAAVA